MSDGPKLTPGQLDAVVASFHAYAASDGDSRWIAEIRREMTYDHWSREHREAFKLALKWWYQAHGLPVPADVA